MKPQDIIFVIFCLFVIFKRKPVWAAIAGSVSLLFAIPLFATWVFFTAERLTWYAAVFFLISAVLYIYRMRSDKNL